MPARTYVLASMRFATPMDSEPEIFFYEPGPERIKNDPV